MGLADLASYTAQAVAQGSISEGAQVMLNNVYDLLASEGFGRGGAQLTPAEWAAAIRSLAPLVSESDASWQDKLARMERRAKALEVSGGPATRRQREAGLFPELDRLLPSEVKSDVPEKTRNRLQDARRRARLPVR
mgnify:CR=1 FL=1